MIFYLNPGRLSVLLHCYQPGIARKKLNQKPATSLKLITRIINEQRKTEYNLDKLFCKQISNNVLNSSLIFKYNFKSFLSDPKMCPSKQI